MINLPGCLEPGRLKRSLLKRKVFQTMRFSTFGPFAIATGLTGNDGFKKLKPQPHLRGQLRFLVAINLAQA